ncbi:MAG: hypothetical protein ACNS62_25505 [Candidatus Cyclobacteriaceae bacterium M3_2C_046]
MDFELHLHPDKNIHDLKVTEAQGDYTISFQLTGQWREALRDIFHHGSPDHFWQCIDIKTFDPESQQYLLKDPERMVSIKEQITLGIMQQMEAELAGEMQFLPWLFQNRQGPSALSKIAELKQKQEQQNLNLYEKAVIKFNVQSMLDLEQQMGPDFFGPPKRKNPYQHLSPAEKDTIRAKLNAKKEELERRLKGLFIINPSITAKYQKYEFQLLDINNKLSDLDGHDQSSGSSSENPGECPF